MTDINKFQHQQHQLKIQSYYTGKSIKQLAQRRFSSSFSGYQQNTLNNSKTISFHSKSNSFGTTYHYQGFNNQLLDFKKRIKMYDQMQSLIYIQKNPMNIFSYSKKQPINNNSFSIQKAKQSNELFNTIKKASANQSTKNVKRRTFKDFLYNKQQISIKNPKTNVNSKNVKQNVLNGKKIDLNKDFQHFPQQSILISPTKYQTLDINLNNSSTNTSILNPSTISTYNNQIHSYYLEQKQKYFKKQTKKEDVSKKQPVQNYQKKKNNQSISRKLFAHSSQNQNAGENNGHTHRSQFKTTIQLKKRPSTGVPIRRKNKNKQSKTISCSKNYNSTTIGINTIQFPNKEFEVNYNRIRIEAHPIKKLQRQMTNQKERYHNPQQQTTKPHTPCYVSLKTSMKRAQASKKKNIINLQQFLPWDSKEQELQIDINNQY